MTCTTHHICDCLKQRMERLEAVAEAAKSIDHTAKTYDFLIGLVGHIPSSDLRVLNIALAELERE